MFVDVHIQLLENLSYLQYQRKKFHDYFLILFSLKGLFIRTV